MHHTNKTLKGLSASESDRARFDNRNAKVLEWLQSAIRPLDHLRLRFLSVSKSMLTRWGDNDDELEEAVEHFNSGLNCQALSNARDLRTLKLRMSANDTQLERNWVPTTQSNIAYLSALGGENNWPKLQKLAISNIRTKEENCVGLILQHKDTLRSL